MKRETTQIVFFNQVTFAILPDLRDTLRSYLLECIRATESSLYNYSFHVLIVHKFFLLILQAVPSSLFFLIPLWQHTTDELTLFARLSSNPNLKIHLLVTLGNFHLKQKLGSDFLTSILTAQGPLSSTLTEASSLRYILASWARRSWLTLAFSNIYESLTLVLIISPILPEAD